MSFFGNKRLIIMLVGLVLLISVMGFTSRERTNLTWVEMFVKDTFRMLQGMFYHPAQSVSHFFQEVGSAYKVYQENRELKASLDQYAQVQARVKLLEAENARLRELLQAKSSLKDFQLRVAEVVARSNDLWNDVVIIDKGSKHGVKKDMAVITSAGLIGRVKTVSNFSSTVELLTGLESSNHISAMIISSRQVNGTTVYQQLNGIVEEYDPRSQLLIMRKIPLGAKIDPEQEVVTSGLGGMIPRGLLIGKVVRVEPGDYGLTQTAYIRPSADLAQLNEVMVVEGSYVVTKEGEMVPSSQPGQSNQPVVPPQGSQDRTPVQTGQGG